MGTVRFLGRLLAALVLTVILALTVMVEDNGTWHQLSRLYAAEAAIDTGEYYFAPEDLTINAGDTVVWTNSGEEAHTISADDSSWGIDFIEPGQSYSHSFAQPGVYSYACVIHNGQTGTITVR